MALNATTADAFATAFCAANGIVDTAAVNKWKSFAELLYSHIKADIAITAVVPTSSIVTVGSAATQTGPAAPVSCTVVVA